MKKDVLSIADLTSKEIKTVLDLTSRIKRMPKSFSSALKDKCIALIFQKPSNRTRVSFEVGMIQLGGHAFYLGPAELKMGVREAVKDVAHTLSRYIDGIVARTHSHKDMEELSRSATVPVINGLTDLEHPCQALCDIYTIKEKLGGFKGVRFSYIGDSNNVLHSLLLAASSVGLNISIATPKGYEPRKEIVERSRRFAKKSGCKISFSNSPEEVAKGADVIYTDVWVSMGQEKEYKERMKAFRTFQVNDKILKLAKKRCLVMHCLPAHRGEEITDSVIDGPNSIVYDQSENRLHTQKAILLMLFERQNKIG